jgi:hypothetical protein
VCRATEATAGFTPFPATRRVRGFETFSSDPLRKAAPDGPAEGVLLCLLRANP